MKFYLTLGFLIVLSMIIDCQIILKSSVSFPHHITKPYLIYFDKVQNNTILIVNIENMGEIKENFTLNGKLKNSKYFQYIKFDKLNKLLEIKFNKISDKKHLVIYYKQNNNYVNSIQIYRKLIDLIIYGTLKFEIINLDYNKNVTEYRCISKNTNYVSMPVISGYKNLSILPEKSFNNISIASVTIIKSPKNNKKMLFCTDKFGDSTNITLKYEDIQIKPNFQYSMPINTTLTCKHSFDKNNTKIVWYISNPIRSIKLSNEILKLREIRNFISCNFYTVSCSVSQLQKGKKIIGRSNIIQFSINDPGENIDKTSFNLLKQICSMKSNLNKLERKVKEINPVKFRKEFENKMSRLRSMLMKEITKLRLDINLYNKTIKIPFTSKHSGNHIWYKSSSFYLNKYHFQIGFKNIPPVYIAFKVFLIKGKYDESIKWPMKNKMQLDIIRKDGKLLYRKLFGYNYEFNEYKNTFQKPINSKGLECSFVAGWNYAIKNNNEATVILSMLK